MLSIGGEGAKNIHTFLLVKPVGPFKVLLAGDRLEKRMPLISGGLFIMFRQYCRS